MSSGTKREPWMAQKMIGALADRFMSPASRLGMSERQRRLNHLWAVYLALQYDGRKFDFDGGEASSEIDREAIASAGAIPPGFYDAGQTVPIKFRKPSAPYPLGRVIVNRFTGQLFSERHHPEVRVQGNPAVEKFLTDVVAHSHLWAQAHQARTFGGAMGSVAVGVKLVDGVLEWEVFDPRWTTCKFSDRARFVVSELEVRYQYQQEELDRQTGVWETNRYWYRRVVGRLRDVTFQPAPVGEGDEPEWVEDPEASFDHGLGFCPAVWTQNLPVTDDVDGEPDAQGCFPIFDAIDQLLAVGFKGTLYNADPTTIIKTKGALGDIKKGSENAIKLLPGDEADYLESTGSGAKSASEMADLLRRNALEVSQCVIDHPDTSQRTATEVDRHYEAMWEKVDVLRGQYGERMVKPLLRLFLKILKALDKRPDPDGGVTRAAIRLPGYGADTGGLTVPDVDPQTPVELQWPSHERPTVDDAGKAVTAAGLALAGGLIDQEHASRYVAPYFDVADVPKMVAQAQAEKKRRDAELDSDLLSRVDAGGGGGGEGHPFGDRGKPGGGG